jgi:hypothetical protein
MCRNIRTLANFDPPATDDELRASALQFVRKLSGTTRPSHTNEEAFQRDRRGDLRRAPPDRLAADHAPPRNREAEARKANCGAGEASSAMSLRPELLDERRGRPEARKAGAPPAFCYALVP